MTTIAYRDGVMAGDTQLTADTTIYRGKKVYSLPNGSLVGGCGTWSKAYMAIDWLLSGEKGESPKFDDAQLLIVKPDGSIWVADAEFPAYPLLNKYLAVGCGAQAAMLAMNNGASAVEAVKQVSKVDSHTSPPVQFLSIEKLTKKKD